MNSFAKRSLLLAALFAFVAPSIALADVNITPSGSTVIFDFTCFTTKHCPAQVPIDAAGAALTGAAGSPSGSALTVQGISGGQAMPVTGTFFQATQPVSATSLPLPTGAATAAGLTTINTTLGTPFQAGGSIGNTTFAATQASAASLNATVVGTGTFATQAAQSGTWNITNVSGTVSLPTGAATSALQTTGNTSLSSIDTKTPALGQALAASSTPVVLTAAQITTLTPLSSVTVTQGTGTNLHVVCDSGCSGSGGTSSNFGSAFPTPGTAAGFSDGTNMVAGRVTTYGTAPTGLNALAVNAFVTNSNANGQAAMASSSPVVIASNQTTLPVTPAATESHLGEVGSNQIKVQVAQTVTASAYATGNALGGLMTVANAARVSGSAGASGTGGILSGLQLNSKTIQTGVQVDVFVFDANPTGSTCTDKSAFVLANADFDKVVGILTIPSTAANGAGWFGATTTGAVGIPTYFPITYDLASSTSLFACAVVRAAITPGSTSDISFKYNILRN